MTQYTVSMISVVFFYLICHLCQRGIPSSVNPAASLVVTYSLSLALSFLLFFLIPAPQGISNAVREVTWISYALAIGVVGLEAGFLLAYRFGWQLGTAAIYSNVSVTLLLIPIGFAFYQERLSLINSLGIFFAILGIVLMNFKA